MRELNIKQLVQYNSFMLFVFWNLYTSPVWLEPLKQHQNHTTVMKEEVIGGKKKTEREKKSSQYDFLLII